MSTINPQATELNETISGASPQVLDMLSTRGKSIFFPAKNAPLTRAAQSATTPFPCWERQPVQAP